jgi:O-antigen/teichoic acid export membrane protein
MADATGATPGRVPFFVFLNASTTVVHALAGFLTLPFLIDRLGAPTYGVWALIVAVTGYFLIFDSGFTGSVGRLAAGKRSLGDIDGLNAVVSTALIAAVPLCGVIALAVSLVSIPFFWLFDVPLAQTGDAHMALLLVGLAMALSLPESIFFGLLWGYERFDLQNIVDIGAVTVRTALILLLINHQSSLLDLSMIIAGTSAAGFVVRAYLCWLAEPRLSVGPRLWSRSILSDLFAFGSWFALLRLSRSRLQDLSTFVIGHLLGTAAVTTFTVPKMLITHSGLLAQSLTQVVAPRAAAYHFGEQHTEQRDLFLTGGRYSLAISLYIFGGFLAVGLPFLTLWQGGTQFEEYQLLIILGVGEILPLSQWATYSAVVGIGKHRRLALLALAEAAFILVGSYVAAIYFGLVGAACAVAVSAFLFRGLFQWTYGCQLLSVTPADYARQVALPILGPAVGAILVLLGLRAGLGLTSWIGLTLAMLFYTVTYWAAVLVALHGWRSAMTFTQAALSKTRARAFRQQ